MWVNLSLFYRIVTPDKIYHLVWYDSETQLRIGELLVTTLVTKHICCKEQYEPFCFKDYSTNSYYDHDDYTTCTTIGRINYHADVINQWHIELLAKKYSYFLSIIDTAIIRVTEIRGGGTNIHSFYMVNNISADVPALNVTRPSPTMVLIPLSSNIPTSAPGLEHYNRQSQIW